MPDKDVQKQRGGITGKGFLPGQSGNPGGRPEKPACVTSQLRDLIEGRPIKLFEKWKKNERNLTGAQIIAMAMFTKMRKGDPQLVKEGLDRIEGKVPQKVVGDPEQPVYIYELSDADLAIIAAEGLIEQVKVVKKNGNGHGRKAKSGRRRNGTAGKA